MTDFNSLKKQYEALTAICMAASDKEAALREFRSRLMIMVLRVWSAQPGFHEDYIPALAMMAEGEKMTEEVICDFMDQAADKPVIPMFPQFPMFTVMVAETGDTSACLSFVYSLVAFLTDMAFINGDCTPEEADEIEQIRMVHMDFYNEYMMTKRRVMAGAISPGSFTYNRYGGTVEYWLDSNGSAVQKNVEQQDSPHVKDDTYLSPSRYSDDVIKVDMQLAKPLGLTDVKVHAWWFDNKLNITGQLYAEKGLRKRFDMQATLYDRDGDVLEQDTNEYYGGGGIRCSTVRQENFFPGYPFRFVFLSPAEAKGDIARIKISFSGIDD